MAAGGEMVAAGLEQPEEKLAKKKNPKSDSFFLPGATPAAGVAGLAVRRSSLTDGERKMLRRVRRRRR